MLTNKKSHKVLLIFFLVLQTGCDWHRLKKCEWYLEPEPEHRHLVKEGWVTVCARNYNTGKQKCYLKLKLKSAEAIYGKKVRYSELEISKTDFPKEIKSFKVCE